MVGGSILGIGGLWLKFRSERRNDLKTIIEQLRAECERKGIESQRFRELYERLANALSLQQLEIVLRRRACSGAIEELKIALARIQATPPDECEEYVARAIRILEEEIVVPFIEAAQNHSDEQTG